MINYNYNFQLVCIILVVFIIQFFCVITLLNIREEPPVYCLMVTGYKDDRLPFAHKSIQNFLNQSYKHKFIVIINQSNTKLLKHNTSNMLEVFVDGSNITLGELRNMSLEFVPPNSIWTTWDDDDIRNTNYLSTMTNQLLHNNVDCILFKHRIEYNIHSNFSFVMTLNSGFMTMFCKKHPDIQYEHVSTNEDVQVKQFVMKRLRYYIYDNDPTDYIRLTHGKNTSIYVDKEKKDLKDTRTNSLYFERYLYPEHCPT